MGAEPSEGRAERPGWLVPRGLPARCAPLACIHAIWGSASGRSPHWTFRKCCMTDFSCIPAGENL